MRHVAVVTTVCLLVSAQPGYAVDPQPQTAVPAGAEPQDATSAQQQEHRFDIWELRVEGNSLLDTTLIERTVYPFVGPDKSIRDVEAARLALETFYRDSGYPTVLVDIPEQDVSEGVVRLKVVQGTVSRVRVTGSRYFSLGRIRAGAPAVAQGEVPYMPALQQQLKEINQASPDRAVTPIFRPGRTPGTVEVDLRVKDKPPLHVDAELNNRYSRDTSELRASGTLRYSNLWQREHSASVIYQTAPQEPGEVRVLAGTYVVPLGGGDVLAAYAVDSKSNVVSAGDLTVIGNGTILGLRYVKPLAEIPGYFHSATFGADYKNFGEDIRPVEGEGFNTPIDYTQFLAQYRGTLLGKDSQLTFGISANFGLRGLGNTVEEFENKRFLAKPNYFYVGVFGEYTRELDRGMQLYLGLDSQWADSPLVSNEQYSAGGAESVRGYYESQVLGDDGVTGNFEVRSPSIGGIPHVSELRFLAFADAAWLRVRQPLVLQVSSYSLYSAGLGLRMKGSQGLDLGLDWAWPLKDANDVEQGDPRAHFSLHYGF